MKKLHVKKQGNNLLKESQIGKEKVLEKLGVMETGLTNVEVTERLAEFGPNQTVEEKKYQICGSLFGRLMIRLSIF